MNKEMETEIKLLLEEWEGFIELDQPPPHDYLSLKNSVLQMELKKEIKALHLLLNDPDTFEEEFKNTLAWRENNIDRVIPFSVMPESLTNQLYWKIAEIVFQPKTMKDMLEIILPEVTSQLCVGIPEFPNTFLTVEERKQHMRAAPIIKQISGLNELTEAPLFETLTHYIIADDKLFDSRELSLLPLRFHASVHKSLESSHPNIAEKLYSHNSSLLALASDIQVLNNKGKRPRAAIEELIQGLKLGGEKMTRAEFASKFSEAAIKRFFEYFNALPPKLKSGLRALSHDKTTIGNIFDVDIEKGNCVETTAYTLNIILLNHPQNALLDAPPKMSLEDLKQLSDKYKISADNKGLETERDSLMTFFMPEYLAAKTIRTMSPNNLEDLLDLHFNFPPTMYYVLWQYVTLDSELLKDFADVIKNGFFNQEQLTELEKAIFSHYTRFENKEPLLVWAKHTRNLNLIRDALSSYAENERLNALRQIAQTYGDTILHKFAKHLDSLVDLLKLIPKSQRFEALWLTNQSKEKVIDLVTCNHHTYYTLVNLLPKRQRLEAALKFPHPLLRSYELSNPDAIMNLFTLFTEHQKMSYLKTTLDNTSVLDLLIINKFCFVRSADSFIPDLLRVHDLLELIIAKNTTPTFFKNNGDAKKLLVGLEQCDSMADMKKFLLKFIKEHAKTQFCNILFNRLDHYVPPKLRLESIKTRWYRTSIIEYLQDQILYLQKGSGLKNQLKRMLAHVLENKEMSMTQLKEEVMAIKKVVMVHQDTGIKGLLKFTWLRNTAPYNELVRVFDLDREDDLIVDDFQKK